MSLINNWVVWLDSFFLWFLTLLTVWRCLINIDEKLYILIIMSSLWWMPYEEKNYWVYAEMFQFDGISDVTFWSMHFDEPSSTIILRKVYSLLYYFYSFSCFYIQVYFWLYFIFVLHFQLKQLFDTFSLCRP